MANCLNCTIEFHPKPDKVRVGRGKYCSHQCYREYNRNHPEHRFWKKVNKTDSCWLWKTSNKKTGYGAFPIWDKNSKKINITAHRFSYMLHYGHIPKGMHVCHTCDIRNCVNPAHLFVGTQKDNIQDALAKNRMPKGDNHYMHQKPDLIRKGEQLSQSKLTEDEVRAIREMSQTLPQKNIAKMFNVSTHAIYCIQKNITWKHVV